MLVQPLALLVRQLLRDADEVRERHQHEEPARQGDVGGHAGALGAHRVLEHLHHELLARLEQRWMSRRGTSSMPSGATTSST